MSIAEPIRRALAPLADLRGRTLWVVIGGVVCQFGLGYGYLWTHLLTDITAELGWTRATFSSGRVALTVVMSLSTLAAGFAFARAGARLLLVGSTLLLVVTTVIQSRMTLVEHWWLAASVQGIACGGLGDVVVGAIVVQWISRGRGLALGIVYAGSNIAATVFSLVLPRLVELFGWRDGVLVCGLGGAAIILPFAWFALREPGPGEGAGSEEPDDEGFDGDAASDLDVWQAMRTRSFWILCFVLAAFFFVFVGVIEHLVPSMRDAGLDGVAAGELFAWITGAAILAKIGFGALTDGIDHRHAMWLQSGVFAVSSALLFTVPTSPLTPLVLAAFGVSTAARDVIYPLIIDYCFGRRHLAQIYGTIMVLLLGGAAGSLYAGILYDRLESYTIVWHSFGALALAAFLATFFLRDERRRLGGAQLAAE